MTNVHLIQIFEGPRHERLERIWRIIAEVYAGRAQVWIHDNRKDKAPHAEMLQRIWQFASEKCQEDVLVTEFDFLPDPAWLDAGLEPIEAAEYCTRDPYSRRLQRHGLVGPWFLHVHRDRTPAGFVPEMRAAGRFTDPCGDLIQEARQGGCRVRLLPGHDDYPRSFGVRYAGKGLHLFWSRHYHDNPFQIISGVILGEMQRKVDAVLAEYEEAFEKCHRR